MQRCILILSIAGLLLTLTHFAARAQDQSSFFLHDGDRVVFYGDSITEQQLYGRDIEDYVVTRFPKWNVKFINSGVGGDVVGGGYEGGVDLRLKRDVLPYKPTVVTIFLGMNDGGYRAFDQELYDNYTKGLIHIVDTLQHDLPHVRLTLLTPSFFDKDADKPSDNVYNQTLIKYGDFVKQLGAQRGIPVADLNAPMMAATAKGRESDPQFTLFGDGHHGDGVHPDEVGHLIMASAVLQAWHAPATVADITLSPSKPVSLTTPLPWPVPDAAKQAFAISPLPGSLDAFTLHGKDLTADNYTLFVDDKPLGMLTKAQLMAGIDLAQNPDLPMNTQAQDAAKIIQVRIDKWHNIYKGGDDAIVSAADKPTSAEITALVSVQNWLDDWRVRAHDAAQPKPHTYELRSVSILAN